MKVDPRDLATDDLNNWGRWLRNEPSPFKHLGIAPIPSSRMVRSKGDTRTAEGFHPDRAYETNAQVHAMTFEDWKVALFAYFVEFQTVTGMMKFFKESRRSSERRLSSAIAAFVVLYYTPSTKIEGDSEL